VPIVAFGAQCNDRSRDLHAKVYFNCAATLKAGFKTVLPAGRGTRSVSLSGTLFNLGFGDSGIHPAKIGKVQQTFLMIRNLLVALVFQRLVSLGDLVDESQHPSVVP
jgi:hypothetical protein